MPAPIIAPLAAIAAALYPRESEAAKFSWLKPERIAKLLDRSAYAQDEQKAKSALAMVSSDDFLKGTTTTPEMRERIVNEAGRFDPYKQQQWLQDSFLMLDPKSKGVIEHESRHRIGALQRAMGRPVQVPVELRAGYDNKMLSPEWKRLSGRTVKGQRFADKDSSPVPLGEVTPLAYDTPPEELMKYATEYDIPLKNIGVMLKPEGPGFGPYDLDAYRHGYIPHGKIPPPKAPFLHPRDALPDREYNELFREWTQLGENRPPWNDWARQFYPEELK